MKILFGDIELRGAMEDLLETKMSLDTRYMGFVANDSMVIVSLSRWNGFDGEITVVSTGKNPPMRAAISHFFDYVWNVCKCRRVTTLCYEENRQAMRFNKMLGFTKEGLMRQAGKEGQDVILFGMLREEFNQRFMRQGDPLRKAA